MAYTASNHPGRRHTDGVHLPQTLVFEDDPVRDQLLAALEQIERLGREGTRDGHLIREAMQEVATKALAPHRIAGVIV